MEPLTLALIAAVAVLALLVVVLLIRHGFSAPTTAPPRRWADPVPAAGRVVVLDIEVDDPQRPSAQRLVRDVGERVLAKRSDLDDIEVRDRRGTTLGHVHRPDPLPQLVETSRDAHAPRPHQPDPVGGTTPPPVDHRGSGVDVIVPQRDFVERFELTDAVRSRVRDADEPIDVVRAILEAAGHDPRLDGEVLIAGDTGFVVARVLDDHPNEILNHAYLRFRDAGLPRGIVIRVGWVNPEYVRYREFAAPMVRHVGTDAIQRMADAVDLGEDPIELALGAPVLR